MGGQEKNRRKTLTAWNGTTLPAEGHRVDYTDKNWAKGGTFQLRVTPKARNYSLLYRSGGAQLREPLGKVGTVSLADAQEKAADTV